MKDGLCQFQDVFYLIRFELGDITTIRFQYPWVPFLVTLRGIQIQGDLLAVPLNTLNTIKPLNSLTCVYLNSYLKNETVLEFTLLTHINKNIQNTIHFKAICVIFLCPLQNVCRVKIL